MHKVWDNHYVKRVLRYLVKNLALLNPTRFYLKSDQEKEMKHQKNLKMQVLRRSHKTQRTF